MLGTQIGHCKRKPVNIHKMTILIDHDYHPNTIIKALQAIYPGIMRKIHFEQSAKPLKTEKATQEKSGLVMVEAR